MPKTALHDLLTQVREHLEGDPGHTNLAERELLIRVHDDIEEVLELSSEVSPARAQQTGSVLEEAAEHLAAHPIGAALGRVAELLAGMGI